MVEVLERVLPVEDEEISALARAKPLPRSR